MPPEYQFDILQGHHASLHADFPLLLLVLLALLLPFLSLSFSFLLSTLFTSSLHPLLSSSHPLLHPASLALLWLAHALPFPLLLSF